MEEEKQRGNRSWKAQVATNAAWGVLKRANIGSLQRRGYLINTLVQTILMYGAEIWGRRERQVVETTAGRHIKMMLGVSRSTPAYIWRMESGRQKLEVEARWKASNYLVSILKMGDERWPKICLKEEMRNWENGNASKWIKEVEMAMRKVGGVGNSGIERRNGRGKVVNKNGRRL